MKKILLLSLVILLWAAVPVLPTYDDWNTLSSPNFDEQWTKYFLPIGSFWRPMDALMGYVVATDYRLFPRLAHVLIVVGHVGSAALVARLGRRLGLSAQASLIGMLFFLVSPCTMATVLACDSLNQTYSQFWGLAAVTAYLGLSGKQLRHPLWLFFVLLAALSKENGLAWAVVPPVVAAGFGLASRREMWRHAALGLALAAGYAAIRLLLPHTSDANPDYAEVNVLKKGREVAMWLAYTWLPADYISLVYAPLRSLKLFAATLLMGLPLAWLVFWRGRKLLMRPAALALLAAILITASPHLLLRLSVMNAYASLAMAALTVAFVANGLKETRLTTAVFGLYLLASLVTDAHHRQCSLESSLAGREMALETIAKSPEEARRVLTITVDRDLPSFSSFCVRPDKAFGWGLAVLHETGYRWPEQLADTTIMACDSALLAPLASHALGRGGYDAVWIVDDRHVSVVTSSAPASY